MAIVDPVTGEFEFCNAGHNPPMLVRASGDRERLTTKGAVLGMIPAYQYACGRAMLEAGDAVMIFSDGVTEALSPKDDEFGEERLTEVLVASRTESADAILEATLEAIRAHAEGRRQSDDITILTLKRV
jgi:phosphoserine phosphatase RsbU/P